MASFYSLPKKLRTAIYDLVLPRGQTYNIYISGQRWWPNPGASVPNLLLTRIPVRDEAGPMFYASNKFQFVDLENHGIDVPGFMGKLDKSPIKYMNNAKIRVSFNFENVYKCQYGHPKLIIHIDMHLVDEDLRDKISKNAGHTGEGDCILPKYRQETNGVVMTLVTAVQYGVLPAGRDLEFSSCIWV